MIYEILQLNQPATFVADNTLTPPKLSVVYSPGGTNGAFVNGIGRTKFDAQDNLIIHSVRVELPYCYSDADNGPFFDLFWNDFAGNTSVVTELNGNSGTLIIPRSNEEHRVYSNTKDEGIFLRYAGGSPGSFSGDVGLSIGTLIASVSQAGAPDSLNGETLNIYAYLGVFHNLPMVV